MRSITSCASENLPGPGMPPLHIGMENLCHSSARSLRPIIIMRYCKKDEYVHVPQIRKYRYFQLRRAKIAIRPHSAGMVGKRSLRWGPTSPDSVASSLRTTFSDVAHECSIFHRHAAYNNLQVSASLSSLLHLLCCSLACFAS